MARSIGAGIDDSKNKRFEPVTGTMPPMTAPVTIESLLDLVAELDPADTQRLHDALDAALKIKATIQRDDLIRAIAATKPGLSKRATAKAVHQDLCRYHSGAWRRERDAGQCPQPRHALMWKLLKIRDAILCERQIRRIIAGT